MGIVKDLRATGSADDKLRAALETEGKKLAELNEDLMNEFKSLQTSVLMHDDELRKPNGNIASLRTKVNHFIIVFRKMRGTASKLSRHGNLEQTMTDLESYCDKLVKGLTALNTALDQGVFANAQEVINYLNKILTEAKTVLAKDISRRYAFIQHTFQKAA